MDAAKMKAIRRREAQLRRGVYVPKFANDLAEKDGDYEGAIAWYTLVLVTKGCEDYRVLFNRAHCFLTVNKLSEALRDIEKVIELKSDWSPGYIKKGEILSQAERFQEAEDEFDKAEWFSNGKSKFQEEAMKWNIFYALKKEFGVDEIKAGYYRERFNKLSTAREALENGDFEETLDWIRSVKRKEARKKNARRLIPNNFY